MGKCITFNLNENILASKTLNFPQIILAFAWTSCLLKRVMLNIKKIESAYNFGKWLRKMVCAKDNLTSNILQSS